MKYLYLIFISLCLCNCSYNNFLKKGTVNINSYFINYDSAQRMPLPNIPRLNKAWFRDSCVILEKRVINTQSYDSGNVRINRSFYDLNGYTYLDLKTKRGQYYLNFSDTALPLYNFIIDLRQIDFLGYGDLRFGKNKPGVEEKFYKLPDTVENGKLYKRFLYMTLYSNAKDTNNYVCYLDCESPKSIFHYDISLGKKYTNCQYVKVVSWSPNFPPNSSRPLRWVSDINITSSKLAPKEKQVFNQWKRNATLTILPVITQDSANQAALKRYHNLQDIKRTKTDSIVN